MSNWIGGTVVDNHRWNDWLCTLKVKAPIPTFEPGQFARLALDVDGEKCARAYSLVSTPGDDVVEFYLNRVPDGPLSNRLYALEKGDTIWLADTVAGYLTLSELPEGRRLWLLATGTGIGPFLSILQAATVWERFEHVIVVHGVRTREGLTYRTLFEQTKQKHPTQFTVIKSITQEQVDDTLSVRIPEAITTGELEEFAGFSFDYDCDRVMVCGNPGMVRDCLEQLSVKGLSRHRRRKPGHVLMEIYK